MSQLVPLVFGPSDNDTPGSLLGLGDKNINPRVIKASVPKENLIPPGV